MPHCLATVEASAAVAAMESNRLELRQTAETGTGVAPKWLPLPRLPLAPVPGMGGAPPAVRRGRAPYSPRMAAAPGSRPVLAATLRHRAAQREAPSANLVPAAAQQGGPASRLAASAARLTMAQVPGKAAARVARLAMALVPGKEAAHVASLPMSSALGKEAAHVARLAHAREADGLAAVAAASAARLASSAMPAESPPSRSGLVE